MGERSAKISANKRATKKATVVVGSSLFLGPPKGGPLCFLVGSQIPSVVKQQNIAEYSLDSTSEFVFLLLLLFVVVSKE